MRKVILGPWQHSGNSRYDMHGVSFGSQALRFDLDYLYFQWFEHYLKGVEKRHRQERPSGILYRGPGHLENRF